MNNERPIGVFDSGVGGLTVLRALIQRLPNERFIYLGDTARLPYGTKSRESVERYALQAAALLVQHDIKCLVVACNTASAVALRALENRFAPLSVIGVIEPGAQAGCHASQSGNIAVIATEGTVRNRAYQTAIARYLPKANVQAQACPLFVALAEEGLTEGPIVEAIAHRYLDPLFQAASHAKPDTLVLGCTHFPVLAEALSVVIGPGVAIVDSAVTSANALECELQRTQSITSSSRSQHDSIRLLATDGCERFARVGSVFLGRSIDAADVELVDLAV